MSENKNFIEELDDDDLLDLVVKSFKKLGFYNFSKITKIRPIFLIMLNNSITIDILATSKFITICMHFYGVTIHECTIESKNHFDFLRMWSTIEEKTDKYKKHHFDVE